MVKDNKFYGIPLDELGLPTRWIGSVPLFNQEDCMKLINYCELNNLGILGVEGFNISENFRTPNMDAIVDFSELMNLDQANFKNRSTVIAKDFISNFYDPSVEFEFNLIK